MSIVAKKIMMGSGAAGDPVDDEFNRTSFLSHFDGTNNGVNSQFTDGSASNHTITANGNVTQGSFGPFARPDGEFGVDFDGSGDYLQVAESSDFDFGTGDFNVEFFFFARDSGSYEYLVTFGNNSNATTSLGIYIAGGTAINLWNNGAITSSTSYNLNQWYHLAVSRASGSVKVYLDGSEIKSASLSSDISSPGGMNVANWRLASDSQYFNGIISNLRVVKGTAVYTGNFTAPTSKLTAITNTKLLTCQSNRFVDNSATGHTVTPYVTSAVTAFGPFLADAVYSAGTNGGSAHFVGGDDDYLSLSPQADFAFGTGDFSVSLWVFFNNVGTYDYLIDGRNSGQTSGTWSLSINYTNSSSGKLMLASGNSAILTSDTNLIQNQWYYISVSRSGTTSRMHFNGTQVAINSSDSTNYSTSPNTSYIGTRYSTEHSFDGIMGDLRVVKGTALSSYTPPTAPLTAITNTKLLLNMADGQAIDSAAQSNLTLFGTAKTSTAQKLFGTASLLLDGNSDLVTFPSEAGLYGSGNFTIEFSFRLAANVGDTPFVAIAKWETSGNQRSWMVRIDNVDSANKIKFFDSPNGSSNTSSTFATSFSNETWYKIAVVNVSGTVSMYVNGTADSTTHSLATGAPYASTSLVSIGANIPSSPSQFFNGNIDDVRLSKFARYTGNYTAQSEPFPDKGR